MNIITGMIPVLLRQVKAVPDADKREFASFISLLCQAYVQDDRESFKTLLRRTSFPAEWKTALIRALWDDENQE